MQVLDAAQHLVHEEGQPLVVQRIADHDAQVGVHSLGEQVNVPEGVQRVLRGVCVQEFDDLSAVKK